VCVCVPSLDSLDNVSCDYCGVEEKEGYFGWKRGKEKREQKGKKGGRRGADFVSVVAAGFGESAQSSAHVAV
jgi:hypothetical protein